MVDFGLDDWASISAIAGAIIAVLTLLYTAVQVRKNTLVNRARFWLELEKMFASHDEVHLNLRPGGKWSTYDTGPHTPEEWAKVEDYMGLFEHCEIMLRNKLIDEDTFRAIFSYRLHNLLANDRIVEEKLMVEGDSWRVFMQLLKRLDVSLPTDAG